MAVSGVTPRTTRSGQNPSASSNNGAIVIENPSQGVNYSRAKNSPTKGRTSTTAAAQDSKSQLSAAKNSLNDLVAEEKLVLGKIKTLLAVIKQLKEYNPSGGNNLIIAQKQKELTAQYTRLSEIKNLKAAVAKRIKEFTSSVAEAETRVAAAVAAQQPTALKEDKSAKMNLSACKELYFRGTEQFMAETKDVSANAPGRAGAPDYLHNTSYKNAELLWGVGIATKGRIQTFVPPSTAGTDSKATKPKDSSSGAMEVLRLTLDLLLQVAVWQTCTLLWGRCSLKYWSTVCLT
jgi:hypothetical protein